VNKGGIAFFQCSVIVVAAVVVCGYKWLWWCTGGGGEVLEEAFRWR